MMMMLAVPGMMPVATMPMSSASATVMHNLVTALTETS
jgi:hypothetical protein